MSVYLIDDSAVNARRDWIHVPVVGGVTGQRTERFPGDGTRYIVKGEPGPDGLDVTGFLQGDDHSALYTEINTYAAIRRARTVHKVTFKGVVFNDQHLEAIVFGRIQGFNAGGGARVRIPVQFNWRGVTP